MNPQIEQLMQPYSHSLSNLNKVSEILDTNFNNGLGVDTNEDAKIKMLVTYVRSLPRGTESGKFLALDLGGTNFRVLIIELDGKDVKMDNKIYSIPEDLMTGPGTELFKRIVDCIDDFVIEKNLKDQYLPLGFTFSFPCKQETIASGRLIVWTKGFSCAGVVDENVVKLLQEAIDEREDLNVKCVALINDTVGCLMSTAFDDNHCQIGVILGTGTNACYMETLDKVHLWDGDEDEPRQVIINTEWGAFGDDGCLDFIRTDEDQNVDSSSINCGKQLYEKMISGMYMGEIARLKIVDLAQKVFLFNGVISEEMNTIQRFHTKFISEVLRDEPDSSFENTQLVLTELGYESVTREDCEIVHYVCDKISLRAASLAATGIVTLMHRIDKPDITIAIDGSLYRFHPKFHQYITDTIDTMLTKDIKYQLRLSEDGSGKGAALVAAVVA